ncbi:MAG: DUF92 domain-containing protein [Candidatus Methanomethylophilaceae archaeon]|nr:DUF92 domain-containing protein [Candidatus Methanomethylophilaceae archaeon]
MDRVIELAIIILVPLVLALFAYKKNLMTPWATVTAYVLAEIIGLCTNIWWVVAFFMFPIVAFLATKWKLKEKMELGLQEGKKGERSVLNLMGVGVIPAAIAIVYAVTGSQQDLLAVAFLSALAVSTSDTVASETGIWAKKTYMITTLKQIEPGPNGGVSLYGFGTSFLGTMLFAFVAYILIFQQFDLSILYALVVVTAGMIGNIMDSVLGAVLENPGYIGKYTNNCSTSLIGAVVGFLLFWVL